MASFQQLPTQQQRQQQQSGTQMSTNTTSVIAADNSNNNNMDRFLSDDFVPLHNASESILAALRADESSPDGDIYRRIVSSGNGSHLYHPVSCIEDERRSGGGALDADGTTSTTQDPSSWGGNTAGFPFLGGGRNPTGGIPARTPPPGPHGSNWAGNSPATSNGGAPFHTSPGAARFNREPPTCTVDHLRSLPLPKYLAQEMESTRFSSLMGLLPEANLAWLSVDERLYLWSYGDISPSFSMVGLQEERQRKVGSQREDFCSFTVPSGQCVVSVGLVKPKKGVFKDVVEWCLVVTTPEEAILCALARESTTAIGTTAMEESEQDGFGSGPDTILRLIPTRFVIPTDSIPLLSVCGTSDGRIFLGGHDGCLYEMSYEGFLTTHQAAKGGIGIEDINEFYDGDGTLNGIEDGSVVKSIASGGKRALSAVFYGLQSTASGFSTGAVPPPRAKKCRKVNHTAVAPGVLAAVVPDPILRAANSLFHGTATGGGPIISMVMDEERKCLYTLSTKGFICAFDMSPPPSTWTDTTISKVAAKPRLACVMDATKSARLYLDSVSRGNLFPPYSSSSRVATISFPGGGASAQAGVGGMNGARTILKAYDAEVQRASSQRSRRLGGRSWMGDNVNDAASIKGILQPVSIHLVRRSESRLLTLVAVTGGGLRYYLTSLPPSAQNSGAPGMAMSWAGGLNLLAPGNKFTMCHIRAPPPFTTEGGRNETLTFEAASSSMMVDGDLAGLNASGLVPGVHNRSGRSGDSTSVVKSYYGDGVVMIAVDAGDSSSSVADRNGGDRGQARGFYSTSTGNTSVDGSNDEGSATRATGDAIVVATPDFAARRVPGMTDSTYGAAVSPSATGRVSNALALLPPSGVSEAVSLPMAYSRNAGGLKSAVMPGGRVWDITSACGGGNWNEHSPLITLLLSSETPTDVELGVGLIPAYFPPSRVRHRQSTGPAQAQNASIASTPTAAARAAMASTPTSAARALVPISNGGGLFSTTLTVISSALFLRPPPIGRMFGGSFPVPDAAGRVAQVMYRISSRHGCESGGFSLTAGGKTASSGKTGGSSVAVTRSRTGRRGTSNGRTVGKAARSARLSPWLLRPNIVSLSSLAVQHLDSHSESNSLIALNSGGLHLFHRSSLLQKLALSLMKATDVGRDDTIRSYFESYGYAEGCAMCLGLATSGSSSDAVKRKASQALLSHAHVPSISQTAATGNNVISEGNTPTGVAGASGVPEGYDFKPSSLHDGLVAFLSRLLRPVWYKPAVVVTEGRTMHSKARRFGYNTQLPAKVELLLDKRTLDEVRRPLYALQSLMRDIFTPAVSVVPGAKKRDGPMNNMEIDEEESNGGQFITMAMQYQSQAARRTESRNQGNQLATKELDSAARLIEERNMHSLYRLLSRSVQLLSLMSHLRRAHSTPELPEVEWGMLHGLTHAQLATTREGQQRIETLLNNLVSTSTEGSGVDYDENSSVEADSLANLLSSQCYLYFSSGSRLTYLGFRAARSALSYPPDSPRRTALSNQAAIYLRSAARNWYNPSLITGRLIHRDDDQGNYESMARRAMDYGSPLARAASVLMELEDVGGVVDVCLICAGNFGGYRAHGDGSGDDIDEDAKEMLPWERGLYHRPLDIVESKGSMIQSNGISSGVDVTPADGLRTCHSIIFYFLSILLDSSAPDSSKLAERMVSVCASHPDINFLHSLYGHLQVSNHLDTLLRIDSPTLENWLRDVKRNQPGLLWRYYVVHDKNSMAGDVMWKRACITGVNVSLDERMECLTRALNSYSASLEEDNVGSQIRRRIPTTASVVAPQAPPSRDEVERIITQINEQLDVAALQKRTLASIEQSQSVDLDASKLHALAFSLVSVSDLYNEYAAPLNLCDLCLLILHTCHHNEPSTIATLWKSILCEELLPCQTRSTSVQSFLNMLKNNSMMEEESIIILNGNSSNSTLQVFENGDWIARLKNRVISLGKELYGKGADYTFPLDLLVESLEGLRHVLDSSVPSAERRSSGSSTPWPLQSMLEVGVPFPEILLSFDKMLDTLHMDVAGTVTAKRLQHLSSIVDVLTQWIIAASTSSHRLVDMPGGTFDGISSLATNESAENAANQLSRAAYSGGLLPKIDAYKASLESLVDGNAIKKSQILSSLNDIEEAIKRLVMK